MHAFSSNLYDYNACVYVRNFESKGLTWKNVVHFWGWRRQETRGAAASWTLEERWGLGWHGTMNHDEPITMNYRYINHKPWFSYGFPMGRAFVFGVPWQPWPGTCETERGPATLAGQRLASFTFASKPEALYLAVRCSTWNTRDSARFYSWIQLIYVYMLIYVDINSLYKSFHYCHSHPLCEGLETQARRCTADHWGAVSLGNPGFLGICSTWPVEIGVS